MPKQPSPALSARSFPWLLGTLACLVLALAILFAGSFVPGQILFSSDGPLGAISARWFRLPAAFRGIWQDLNWVGAWGGNAPPNLTHLWLWLIGPWGFAKFYAPLSVLALGLGYCLLFRQLRFQPWVCLLGALAGALNTGFFSYACWGLGTLTLCIAWMVVALAAIITPWPDRAWLRAGVAGFAVGMAILEGADSGAILSLYVGAFMLFQTLQGAWGSWRAWTLGMARVGIVALCAALVAVAALSMLISTQIKGVVGMQQDSRTKVQRWEEATQWSLPKWETLRVIIPGVFGYRLDSPEGGNYWGRVGERPGVLPRHSGSGVYCGVVVVVLALWGAANSLRGRGGPFTPDERRQVWFWGVAACLSLGLAWGKHAFFYQFLYALPYFSTIRNPIKFMHPFSLSVVILSGYGLQALGRAYFDQAGAAAGLAAKSLKTWWAKASPFERKWCLGSAFAWGGSLLGWLLYAASRSNLEDHLKTAVSPDLAPAIARFSLIEVGWFLLFLALTLSILVVILSRVLGASRARWALVALGLVLVADLMRANVPWVVYWNYKDKYATNPVIETLRSEIPAHRVALPPFQLGEPYDLLQQLYHAEWMQHQFQHYNVQSLDVIQEPRTSIENARYRAAFAAQREAGLVRQWQLTNTRFLLALTGDVLNLFNQRLDPAQQRFRLHTAFTLHQERAGGPILVRTNTAGPFALLEFTGALPRGRLYTRWQVSTNEDEVLQTLTNPAFDPAETVLVTGPVEGLPVSSSAVEASGTVEVVNYASKRFELIARAAAPSVLLWNDKFDPQWTVTVDGQPQTLLRCNYLMRGVAVPAGEHRIEFRFSTSPRPLYTSLGAIAIGLVLAGLLFLGGKASRPEDAG